MPDPTLVEWFFFPRCLPDHAWVSEFSRDDCPYGAAGPGGVTWPSMLRRHSNGQVTPAWEVEPGGLLLALCVVNSYVPAIIVAWSLLGFVLRRGTREVSFLCFILLDFCTNSMILKRIMYQPRPEESCLLTCGMPSTRAALAMGFFTLRYYDYLMRSQARGVFGAPAAQHRPRARGASVSPFTRRYSRFKRASFWALLRHTVVEVCSTLPLSSWDEITNEQQIIYLLGWMVMLLPVPMSSVVLRDNTPLQALAGSFFGIVLGATWSVVLRVLQHRFNHRLGCVLLGPSWFPLLRHNHALPCFVAEQRCRVLLSRSSYAGSSLAPSTELEWYLAQTVQRRRVLEEADHLTASEHAYLSDREGRLRELVRTPDSLVAEALATPTGSFDPGTPTWESSYSGTELARPRTGAHLSCATDPDDGINLVHAAPGEVMELR